MRSKDIHKKRDELGLQVSIEKQNQLLLLVELFTGRKERSSDKGNTAWISRTRPEANMEEANQIKHKEDKE